jgi:hypothetical protein
MTKQVKHVRRSKKGKPFLAGSKKPVAPKRDINLFYIEIPGIFKKLIEGLNAVLGEVQFIINSNHIFLREMDPANVAMVNMEIKSSPALKIDKEGINRKFVLNVKNLKDKLKELHIKLPIQVSLSPDHNKLHLHQGDTKMVLDIIDNKDWKEQKMPDLKELTSKCKCQPAELRMAIKQAAVGSESIIFTSKPGKLMWSADQSSGGIVGAMTGKTDIKAKYSLEYLKKLTQDYGLYETAMFAYGTDYPMHLVMDGEIATKICILAPRVGDDDVTEKKAAEKRPVFEIFNVEYGKGGEDFELMQVSVVDKDKKANPEGKSTWLTFGPASLEAAYPRDKDNEIDYPDEPDSQISHYVPDKIIQDRDAVAAVKAYNSTDVTEFEVNYE